MAINNNPVSSVDDIRSKYSEYFENTDKSLVSVDTFFQLLMAEMTNQDPMEPTSNTEFVSQLASFTGLQAQEQNLYYSTVNYATSLAGKTVTVSVRDGVDNNGQVKLKTITGLVTGVDISDEKDIQVTENGQRYSIGSVMNVVGIPESTSGDGAYAVSLIGKKVMLKAENSDGQTILDTGTVDSIEVENGEYRVVMNGLSYPLDSVIKVGDFGKTSGSDANNSTNTEDKAENEGETETKPSENTGTAGTTDDNSSTEDSADSKSMDLMDMILMT